jgi:hypothetical protein
MSRRSAAWIALVVGIVTVVALVLAGRQRRRPVAAGTDWAPDPGPKSITSPATTDGAVMQTDTEVRLDSPTAAKAMVAPAPVERPLPMWIRLSIVGVALLAFLAVSLIATKGV